MKTKYEFLISFPLSRIHVFGYDKNVFIHDMTRITTWFSTRIKLQSINFIKGDFVFENSDVREKFNVTCVAKLMEVDCKFFALECKHIKVSQFLL